MKRSLISTLAAIAAGTGVFFLIGHYIVIPSPIQDTNISLQYGVLAFLAALYGPAAGAATGFLGNLLIDVCSGEKIWWSWILASALYGCITGFSSRYLHIWNGRFGSKGVQVFNVFQIAGSLAAWTGLSPLLDVLIHKDPLLLSFHQGATAGSFNIIVTMALGTLLCWLFAAWRRKKTA